MDNNKIWIKTIDFLKAGAGVSILIFAINCLGYFYMSGYLSYFNINMSFHEFNLFNDFFDLIIAILLFVLPVIEISIILFLVYSFFKIPNLAQWIKTNINKTLLFLCMIIILIVAFPFCNYYVYQNYNISLCYTIKIFYSLLIVEIIISAIIYCVSIFIKNYLQKDAIDILFISFIILSFFLIISPKIEGFGRGVAMSKESFIILDNEFIVLYNTSDYALVTKYEKSKDNKDVQIFANEFLRTDLTNHNISYIKFDTHPKIIK